MTITDTEYRQIAKKPKGYMKVKTSLKADATKGDKIVKRKGVLYRINKRNPRRKAKQG